MFLIRPELPENEKTTSEHPWARRIKDAFANKIKYAHNSISNPQYPKKKEKYLSDANRIKFTIIGDRVTKEFIYCSKLVKGLYKYRKMVFDAPVIQGITTVEWPTVWNDLKARYGGMAYCLTSSVAVIINKKFLGGVTELKELIESKFLYHLSLDYYKESIAEFAKFITGSGRPCVFMKISIDGADIGTFIFMLYSDILPFTCANFLRLCKETKGGYSGTRIHRIVKDGWIQGGGFGLKETDLDCENFIVPHDRRGVLCMANSGIHMECSTQFFVLLQPAPWMARRFVAFGQLIEGKGTLEAIEAVPTRYESPTSEIIIYKAGIFNMDCHDIMINKSANAYIDRHIEDLNELGELFYAELLENVFLTAQMRELERLKKEQEGEGEEGGDEDAAAGVRETKRFNRRKEDIEKQLQTSKVEQPSRPSTVVSRTTGSAVKHPASATANENNDFDVETYDPEFEETDYQHQSLHTPSLIVKPKIPYYIPLTDVLYPGEKDSHFDLKRFLQGDYCLESDLKEPAKSFVNEEVSQYPSELFEIEESDEENVDSGDEKELKKYLKNYVDRVSFAGGVVRSIGKGAARYNFFEGRRKSDLITDDQLRRMRLIAKEFKQRPNEKKVSISLPSERPTHIQIKRRQTGFVRPEDLRQMLHSFGQDDEDDDEDEKEKDDDDKEDGDDGERKVRIAPSASMGSVRKVNRRPTAFVRHIDIEKDIEKDDDDDDEDDDDVPECSQKVRIAETISEPKKQVSRRPTAFVRNPVTADDDDDDDRDDDDDNDDDDYKSGYMGHDDDDDEIPDTRKSVLARLFEEVKGTDEPPTLKEYKPMSETHPMNLLTFSSHFLKSNSEGNKDQDRYIRHSITVENDSYQQVLNLQHGKKVARKISSDYVKTIDQIEHRIENSIRSVEFSKTRPAMSVAEYQQKNRKYQEQKSSLPTRKGLRLPGDTPLHSQEDLKEKVKENEKAVKALKPHQRQLSRHQSRV